MRQEGMREILIAGGGPAGAAAAIAARREGSPVRLFDRRASCRHKVCGEFISSRASEVLAALEVWDEFVACAPCRIRRCVLHFGNRSRQWSLPESGWGLSRLQLDRLLLDEAALLGATVLRGEPFDAAPFRGSEGALILACGRRPHAESADRLFGFKAHFAGACDDAVELFFENSGYTGVSGIEDHRTNVCGIAPESVLQRHGFDFDEMLLHPGPLRERLGPLRRCTRWFVTGPLSFSMPARRAADDRIYPAGDALGFVDPFTGTGILNALLTGRLAGIAAARRIPASDHLARCRSLLHGAYLVSAVLRRLVGSSHALWLTRYVPPPLLYRWTRAGGSVM